jgi:phosphoglycolate phosphatase
MVGDRHHDIDGAKVNNLQSVGVLYGFGDLYELKNAKADYIVDTSVDLLNLLLKL